VAEKIVIADYDPDWSVQFNRIKTELAAALGTLAVAIEHVGSTSVPGLAAKPILDIDIAVASVSDVPTAIQLLARLDYKHEGDLGIKGREAFSIPDGAYPHHPYVVTADGREFKRHIAFRNRLRRDESVASEYEQLKRQLAAQYGAGRDGYSRAKTEFVERILNEKLGADH
jgi:GrpB-like predicted nucleotidyltransferase (UPF0157 family)